VTKLVEVGIRVDVEFFHVADKTKLAVTYNIVRPYESNYSDNFAGSYANALFESIEKSCHNYSFNSILNEYMHRFRIQMNELKASRDIITKKLIAETNNIEYWLWNQCSHDGYIFGDKWLDIDDILNATKKQQIYWWCIEEKKGSNVSTFLYETYYRNVFIYAHLESHLYAFQEYMTKAKFYVRKEYGHDETVTIENKTIMKTLHDSYFRMRDLEYREQKMMIKENKGNILIDFTDIPMTPRMKEFKENHIINFTSNNFFFVIPSRNLPVSMYELYYENTEYFEKILTQHTIDPDLLEYVKNNPKKEPEQAFFEYKVSHKENFNDNELIKLTQKGLIHWGDKQGRWGPNNTRINNYAAYYNQEILLRKDDKEMSLELVEAVKESARRS